jgi:hypothetical protein
MTSPAARQTSTDAWRSFRQLPWQRIATTLAVAALVAWGVGFVAGLIVRVALAP